MNIEQDKLKMDNKLRDQIQRENVQLEEIKRNRDIIRNESE